MATPGARPRTSVDALVRSYLDHLSVERGVSPHTSSAYARDLRRYALRLAEQGATRLDQVTPALVDAYAVSLRQGEADPGGGWRHRPLAPASVARAVVAVRSLHRFGLEEGLSDDDPAARVQPPAPGRRLPKALSVEQVQAVLDVPDPDSSLGLRDLALLELLYGTGARITELVSLDVDDVARAVFDGVSRTVFDGVSRAAPDGVPGADALPPAPDAAPRPGLRLLGKGSKERLVPLGSYARAALQAYLVRARPGLAALGPGSPALFLNARGGRLSRQSAWTILQSAAEQAGLGVGVSPHTLRHSFATHLIDGGADVRVVQELLGHASVTTTQIYTLVTVDHLREVYLGAHPRAY